MPELCRYLKVFIESLGHECVDFGPESFNEKDDYPDFMFPAAHAVAEGSCEMGIILGDGDGPLGT